MLFDINESYTSELCAQQAQFNLEQMKKLDTEISMLTKTLKSFPDWECPGFENQDIVYALQNKIDYLSDYADNYERQVDYWQTQKYYALLREKKN